MGIVDFDGFRFEGGGFWGFGLKLTYLRAPLVVSSALS